MLCGTGCSTTALTVVEAARVPHPVVAAAAAVEVSRVGAVKHVDAVLHDANARGTETCARQLMSMHGSSSRAGGGEHDGGGTSASGSAAAAAATAAAPCMPARSTPALRINPPWCSWRRASAQCPSEPPCPACRPGGGRSAGLAWASSRAGETRPRCLVPRFRLLHRHLPARVGRKSTAQHHKGPFEVALQTAGRRAAGCAVPRTCAPRRSSP